MKVKICGLTSLEDALQAADAGADMLGFNFYPPSPRYLNSSQCSLIIAGLQEHGVCVTTVGVFVNTPPKEIASVLDGCGLDLAQLSGDEPPEDLQALGERAFKALRTAKARDLQEDIHHYRSRKNPPACLVDAYQAGEYGGTGLTADWRLARNLSLEQPILLAGGLTPVNVWRAITQVQPWGVDVASGVETSPGRKDAQKIRDFIHAARRQDAALNLIQESKR
jgi:phosphoribosylanthranilate isomerase